MPKPGETLAKQLRDEADRISRLGYDRYGCAHELRRQAADVASAQSSLDFSKRERRIKVS